jgi:Stress up-regulated Nod 19
MKNVLLVWLSLLVLLVLLCSCDANVLRGEQRAIFGDKEMVLQPNKALEVSFQHDRPEPSRAVGVSFVRLLLFDKDTGEPLLDDSKAYMHHYLGSVTRASVAEEIAKANCRTRESWYASDGKRTPVEIPDPYVYVLGRGTRTAATVKLVNQLDVVLRVTVRIEMGWVPIEEDAPNTNFATALPISYSLLSVPRCGVKFDLSGSGGVDVRQAVYTVPVDGVLVYAKGHMHPGGLNVSLYLEEQEQGGANNNNDKQLVFTSQAAYSESGLLLQMSSEPILHPVAAGTRMTIVSRYSNEAPVRGAMGMLFLYFYADGTTSAGIQ